MKNIEGCLVCRIISREEPVPLIYEDADTIVFPMWYPLTKGHTMVCPKNHYSDIFDADAESLSKVLATTQKIVHRMRAVLGVNSVNLINNSGKFAGQDVFHFHIHIIPRRKGDKLNLKRWWLDKARNASKTEVDTLAERLRK